MKPHKWAKEISHFVNGGEVEVRLHNGTQWLKIDHLYEFGADLEFRVKPQKKTMKAAVFVDSRDGQVVIRDDRYPLNSYWKQASPWTAIEYEDPQN